MGRQKSWRGHWPVFKVSLAGQYLAMQLLIIAVVITGAVAVSLTQAIGNFERAEGRRSLSAAESLAANPLVRNMLPSAEPEMGAALPALAETARSISGLRFVAIADESGTVITSSVPQDVGGMIANGSSVVMQGRSWQGSVYRGGDRVLMAQVPVYNADGHMIGIISAGQNYPTTPELLRDIAPSALLTLAVSVLLGIAGSYLFARRVKRQTRGLEPREIAELFEHREALLHGVKEGIIAVSPEHRVTLANEEARELLGLPEDCTGRTLSELGLEPQLIGALINPQVAPDRQVLISERVAVFNRMPVHAGGKDLGSVTTFRDRTELTELRKELGNTKATSDMLRAQTHEFANQLHTISGLIQLEEYDEVLTFIDGVSLSRSQLYESVSAKMADPTIAALLIAKASVATERGIRLEISERSGLQRCPDDFSRDLATVLGNLLDNAIDAVAGRHAAHIDLDLVDDGDMITLKVADNGPGVEPEAAAEIFVQGFSTKDNRGGVGRGFGLALTRLVCERHAGTISVTSNHGAIFTAHMSKQEAGAIHA